MENPGFPPAMNFLDLPYEIQEFIYNKLNILDKCAFDRTAKFKYIQRRRCIEYQKQVGVLYKLIMQKQIIELSLMQLRTLSIYNKLYPEDPSIQEIALIFPKVYNEPYETVYDKLKSGTITEDYLNNLVFSDLYTSQYLYKQDLDQIIAEQTPDVFKLLYKNEHLQKYINQLRFSIYHKIIEYAQQGNDDLFVYIRTSQLFGDEMFYDYIKKDIVSLMNTKKRKFIIKHCTFTHEEIETIKKRCLDNLYIDVYLDFAKL